MINTINPFTKSKIKTYNFLSFDELNSKLNYCLKTYNSWKKSDLDERKRLSLKLAKLLSEKTNILAELISTEMGKPIQESMAEIQKCAELISFYTSNFKNFLADEMIDQHAKIQFAPTGAVFGIMPWNFPFWQVFRFAFPNIIAGNTAILKHAPTTFGCGEAIESLFLEAGFPEHVFTNLMIDTHQTEQVIAHKAVQGVCVTGSTKAGSAVGALAGKHLKKSVLELGGTDAAVILKDADLVIALGNTFKARMLNAGQVCIAPKRIYIHQSQLQTAIDFCKNSLEQIVLGNPLDKATTMGPISKSDFLPVIEKQVNLLVKHGAELFCGGQIKAPFFLPTLAVVNMDNPILLKEIFGPVICLIPFEDEQEVIKNINNSEYGLGTALWTKDLKKANELSSKIETGYIAINSIVKSNAKYPFGGIKHSGYGKELGKDGFKSFLNAKTIVTSL